MPLDESREFGIHELFFSTTDRKGVITFGNDVFARVSGYPLAQLLGAPHNLIRHPDMPRAVFKLLWDHLLAGRPIAAYVKNMAADGRHYWVVALAAPNEGGYLSVRFKPSGPLLAVIEGVYRELRDIELKHDARGDEPKAGMLAAEARLAEILHEKGFASYDAFMHTMLPLELKSRDERLSGEKRILLPPLPPLQADEEPFGATLRPAYAEAQQMHAQISVLSAQLGEVARLNEKLDAQTRAVLGLTGDFRYVSLNIAIKSAKLGEQGRALGVISGHMGQTSGHVAAIVTGLAAKVAAVTGRLGSATFSLEWARLQFEMAIVRYREILLAATRGGTPGGSADASTMSLGGLPSAFGESTRLAVQDLSLLEQDLRALNTNIDDLGKAMLTLQVSHVAGLVEVSRQSDDGDLTAIFNNARTQIDDTWKRLGELNQVLGQLADLAGDTPAVARTLAAAAGRLKRDESTLAGFGPSLEIPAAPACGPTPSKARRPRFPAFTTPPAVRPPRKTLNPVKIFSPRAEGGQGDSFFSPRALTRIPTH